MVAWVPTGINTGVSISPCGVFITPALAPVDLSMCCNSKLKNDLFSSMILINTLPTYIKLQFIMDKSSIPLLSMYLKLKKCLSVIFGFLLNLQVLIFGWILIVAWQIWRDYPRWVPSCILDVKDGDTLTYRPMYEPHQIYTGRLWRVDAFELSQKPWGRVGTQKLIQYLNFNKEVSIVEGCQKVYVKYIKKDIYQRNLILLKKNKLDHQSINERLLASGWALLFPSSEWSNGEKLKWQNLQSQARLHKKGVWKYPKKYWQNPWQFRKSQRRNI
jgi:endonuclease YncB( thermonuclease family)